MARPTKYRAAYCQVAKKICEMGGIDTDVAEAIGVAESTITLWKLKHKPFSVALRLGKEPLNERIKEALAHRALGYSHPDTHISVYYGKVIKTPIIKHYPPSEAALKLWLYARCPDEFRPGPEVETSEDIAAALAALLESLPG